MTDLSDIYCTSVPDIIADICMSPGMQRLKDVGMNCGCEYTSFPRFLGIPPYSRFEHSVGVGLIVWNFTHDPAQTAAGLLHDIATPCFAHVVDFLRGDHLSQESTEGGTEAMIKNSAAIQAALKKYGLSTEAVRDYHIYPVADNDTPRLSADRLEYTLGNIVNFGFRGAETAREYYRDLAVDQNSEGAPEIMFSDAEIAREFFLDGMKCAEIYVSDVDRFAMQALAEVLKRAISAGAVSDADLMGSEKDIIEKLTACPSSRADWDIFRAYRDVIRADAPGKEHMWRKIPAKKRYIDPCVQKKGRVSRIYPECGEIIREFTSRSQDYWVMGI